MKSLVIALSLVVSAAVAPASDFSNRFTPAILDLETAVQTDDGPGIQAALSRLRLAEASSPPERALSLYAIGYADWRLAFVPGTSTADRKSLLDDAQRQFEAVLAINANHAEAHAMLSSVLGSQIAFARIRAAELGPQSSGEIAKALAVEPNNPRVLLIQGMGLLHTPEEWGGGAAAAEPVLRRAVQLFNGEPPQRPWPNWGRADAHLWLGQTLEKNGNIAAARAEYEEALRLMPQSKFARAMLLRVKAK
jgi:tetratricopeptide (TPR) repeat protein